VGQRPPSRPLESRRTPRDAGDRHRAFPARRTHSPPRNASVEAILSSTNVSERGKNSAVPDPRHPQSPLGGLRPPLPPYAVSKAVTEDGWIELITNICNFTEFYLEQNPPTSPDVSPSPCPHVTKGLAGTRGWTWTTPGRQWRREGGTSCPGKDADPRHQPNAGVSGSRTRRWDGCGRRSGAWRAALELLLCPALILGLFSPILG